jgi:hypothetical protein
MYESLWTGPAVPLEDYRRVTRRELFGRRKVKLRHIMQTEYNPL